MEKVPFDELAVTPPPPQPASTHKAGIAAIAIARPARLLRRVERDCAPTRINPRTRHSGLCCGISSKPSGSFPIHCRQIAAFVDNCRLPRPSTPAKL
jgi:hypothetical protein